MGQPPHRIDILQQIDSIDFDEAWANRLDAMVDGEVSVHVISKDDLIRNKLHCGRPRDLLDVEELRQAGSTE